MDNDEKYIELICNGEFNAVPDFKIGELFESFFDNINYNVVKENNEVYVDFTGDAMCDDEPCTILIRFIIDNNIEEFEIKEVKVNEDIILDEDEIMDLLEDIAYVGGAVLDDEDEECTHDCGTCNYDCNIDFISDDELYDENQNEENDDDNEEEEK